LDFALREPKILGAIKMARASSLCDSGGHFKGIINGKEKPTLRMGKS
jgi:hypothetical protein